MLIAIDASRAAEPQKTGVGWYCVHLLRALQSVIPNDVRVRLYSDRPLPPELRQLPAHWEERTLAWQVPLPSPGAGWRKRLPLWSQIRFAIQVLRDRPEVVFIPAHVIPDLLAVYRTQCHTAPRIVTTVHDVAFRSHPHTYPARERWYADRATRLALRAADTVIVPTEAVREEVMRYYGAFAARIAVIPHGVVTRPLGGEQRCASRDPFLLYVGRRERKKNVARMVDAFSRIGAEFPQLRFVLVGPPGYGYEEGEQAMARSPVRDRILVHGWIPPEQYDVLRATADVLCFPTLAEGFGLPMLEAMAVGTPVLTSRGGAHEEVAGDAAELVNPWDVESIAHGLRHLLSSTALRDVYRARGRLRASGYTWNRAARATWDVLRAY
ncbi:glycosyltransferase family 4 protein [Candidatus Uhrbacteria bacterium]|nr:glycosyltransferase family 4 protein [Candidatus Uhrbacteria bacterium]